MPTAAQGRARTPRASRRHLHSLGYGSSPEPPSVARSIAATHGAPQPTPVRLGRSGRTIVTTPSLAHLLGANAPATRSEGGLPAGPELVHYQNHQRKVLDQLLSESSRSGHATTVAAELLREYHPKRYQTLVAGAAVAAERRTRKQAVGVAMQHPSQGEAGFTRAQQKQAMGYGPLPQTAQGARRWWHGAEANQRDALLNSLADRGDPAARAELTRRSGQSGLVNFAGELIPDSPVEIAALAAGGPLLRGGGALISAGARAAGRSGVEAVAGASQQALERVAASKAAQTVAGTGRLVGQGVRHRKGVQRVVQGVGRVSAAQAAGRTGVREATAAALDVGGYAARRAGTAVSERFPRTAAGVTTAGRVGAQGARIGTAPLRYSAKHPFKVFGAGPVALQVPSAGSSSDPIGELKKGLEGQGLAVTTAGKIAQGVADAAPGTVAQNLVKDALNLPAQALPSIYLPVAAAVEYAAKGDDSRAKQLLADYGKTGIIPALAKGDVSGALARLKQHPLFGALEVSGAYAGVGRGAGAIGRSGALGRGAAEYAGVAREPLQIYGHQQQAREYSRNLITARGQRRAEQRVRGRGARFAESRSPRRNPNFTDPNQATPRQAEQFLRGVKAEGAHQGAYGAVDRSVDRMEQVRRLHQQEAIKQRHEARPGAHSHTIVAEIAQGSIRTPKTFHEDLASRRDELMHSLHAEGDNALTRRERTAVRAQLDSIEKALKLPADSPRVKELFASADAYAKDIAPHEQTLHELGLYSPEAVRTAKLHPFAQRHMGARFGRPSHVENRLAQIDAELQGKGKGNVRGQAHNVRQATAEAQIAVRGVVDAEKKLQTAKRNNKGTERHNQLEAQARLAVGHAQQRLDQARIAERQVRATPKKTKAQATREQRNTLRDERAQLLVDHPEGLIGPDGKKLDPAAMEAAAQKQLGRQPAFLTHRPGFRGRGNYYQPFAAGRGRGRTQRRTGEGFRRGTYDASYEALTEQHIQMRTVTDRAKHFDQTIEHFATPKPNGDWYKGWGEADSVAQDPEAHGVETHGIPMVPIRIAPMRALARELAAVHKGDFANAELLSEQALTNPDRVPIALREKVTSAMERALQPGTGAGDVGLIPEAVVQRLREHNAPPRPAEKVMQSYTSAFKNTVLPLSDKWVLGNVFEVEMRSLFNGLGLGQPGTTGGLHRLGRRYISEYQAMHGPEATKQMIVQTIGGGHYSSVGRTEVFRRDMHEFSKAFNAVISKPGPRQLYYLWDKYKSAIFKGNAWFERQPQYAALGKAVKREVDQRTGKWHTALTVSDEALKDLVRGDIRTAAQEKYAKAIEDTFGKWGKNSPGARHFLVGYAPFYMWARAATRFVMVTLPMKHPIKTALIAAGAEMTETERKKYGLDLFAKDRVPGFLSGSIPLASGGVQPTSNFSSFGVFADYPNALSNFVLPQFGGLDTLRGLGPFGDKIELSGGGQPNAGQLVGLAMYSQLEAMLPTLAIARRIEEGGGTSADTSNIVSPKVTKGTAAGRSFMGGVRRAFGLRSYDRQTLAFLRTLPNSRSIQVPVSGGSAAPGGSSGSQWWGGSSSGGSGSQWWSGSSGGSSGGSSSQWWSH